MSSKPATSTTADDQSDDPLDTLFEVSEELQIIADSDAEWAKYAKEGLRKLQEAGYDV